MDIEADSPRRVTRSMTRERLSDAMTDILTRARKATLLAKQSLDVAESHSSLSRIHKVKACIAER